MSTFTPKGNVITNSVVETPGQEKRVLMVGRQEAAGTAESKKLTQDVTAESALDLYGVDSLLADAIIEFQEYNPYTHIDAIGILESAAGSPSVATITFTGTAANQGTIKVSAVKQKGGTALANKGNAFAEVLVETGDTESVVATKIYDAMTLELTAQDPITIADDTSGVLTLTSTINSSVCDSFYLQVEGINLIVGLSAELQHWSGGVGIYDYTLAELREQAGGIKYNICWVNNDIDINIMVAYLEENRLISCNDDNGGVGIFGYISNYIDILNTVALYPSQLIGMIVDRQETTPLPANVNSALGTPSHLLAASFMALNNIRLEDGVVIANILQNNSSDVQTGGIQTLAIPLANTIINNIPYRDKKFINNTSIDFTNIEKNALAEAGAICLQCDKATNRITLGRTVVTNHASTGYNIEDSQVELIIASDIFNIAQENLKQVGFTSGEIPSNNNAVRNTAQVTDFLTLQYFPGLRNIGLLDNSQESIDLTGETLVIEFDNQELNIAFSTRTAFRLEAFTININNVRI